MTKCGFCHRELPESGTNFIGYVSILRNTEQIPCCGGCRKAKKYQFVRLRKVSQTTESQPPIS